MNGITVRIFNFVQDTREIRTHTICICTNTDGQIENKLMKTEIKKYINLLLIKKLRIPKPKLSHQHRQDSITQCVALNRK